RCPKARYHPSRCRGPERRNLTQRTVATRAMHSPRGSLGSGNGRCSIGWASSGTPRHGARDEPHSPVTPTPQLVPRPGEVLGLARIRTEPAGPATQVTEVTRLRPYAILPAVAGAGIERPDAVLFGAWTEGDTVAGQVLVERH